MAVLIFMKDVIQDKKYEEGALIRKEGSQWET